MDELVKDLDKLYGIIGDAADLFNETKMMFKDNPDAAAQDIINDINAFLGEGSLRFEEESEKKLQQLRIELDKTNERVKEIDAKIAEAESKLEEYKALEDSEEKTRLITEATATLNSLKDERKDILKEKKSLESKIAKLEDMNKKLKAMLQSGKKYRITGKVSRVMSTFLGTEDLGLIAEIVSKTDTELSEEAYDELFDKFASALNKDMSTESKAKLKSALFPYVSTAMGDKELNEDELKAIITKYKADISVDEELSSDESERRAVPSVPEPESREAGRAAAPAATPATRTATPPASSAAPAAESRTVPSASEMGRRPISTDQSIAILMSSGVLPQLELPELTKICKQVGINISEKGLNTVLNKDQLHRLLYHKDVREGLLKKSLTEKTDSIMIEYDSMIAKYDKLIKDIEENSISFSPEFLEKVKGIREKLVVERENYKKSSDKLVGKTEIKGNAIDKVNSKLNSKYKEFDKFKRLGKEKKMQKVYTQIEKLRGKEIKLMSKQVRVANKNCDRFIEISNREHDAYQRKQESVLATAGKIFEYKAEIDERMASNNEIRDDMLMNGFENGLSRREIRQGNRDIKRNNRKIQQLMRKQGRVDRNFQHTKISERLEEYYSTFTR